MSFKQRTLEELAAKRGRLAGKFGFLGLDGFVDTIVRPVGLRHGPGDAFEPIQTIGAFGSRISAAAGKSTNIELAPRMEKLGGNGPILANALIAAGLRVKYVGALGVGHPHPVFQEFAQRSEAATIAAPGFTTAVEFTDGKVMLGITRSLEEITYQRIVSALGEGVFLDLLSRADLIGLVNWTMIPEMTAIFNAFVDRALAALPPRENRSFFFDLADPEKRSTGDLLSALQAISRFQAHGQAILGLNLKEAQQVGAALGVGGAGEGADGLRRLASEIRRSLNLGCVVVHPKESAACATREDTWHVPGPYTDAPLITTGAGDHFNAGFCTGQLLGLSPEACLTVGVCTSGHYVRTGISPSLATIDSFLRNWA